MTTATDAPQCMGALAKANEVRMRHAAFRRRVAAMPSDDGRRYVAAALAIEDAEIADATVIYVLAAIRQFKTTRVNQLLIDAGIKRTWSRERGNGQTMRLLVVRDLTPAELGSLVAAVSPTPTAVGGDQK
jgi:hypothetical protein